MILRPTVRARRQRLRAIRTAATWTAASLLLACEPADVSNSAATAPVVTVPEPGADALPPVLVAPIEPPPATAPPPATQRIARARREAQPPVEAEPAPFAPDPSVVPIDILLQPPRDTGPTTRPIDLGADSPEPNQPTQAPQPGAIDRLKSHVRVERRSELLGPTGPRQVQHSETEAALRIPVDDSVSLEGGVRVDQRDDPGAKAPQRRSTPQVGVEVRF